MVDEKSGRGIEVKAARKQRHLNEFHTLFALYSIYINYPKY